MSERTSDIVAAVDLGSNSFHMIVCRIQNGHLVVLDRIKEMVRLGAGIDPETKILSSEAQQRALDCLSRFGQRVRDLPLQNVRIVGTNTLRSAQGSDDFIKAAEQQLNHPIEVISGIEEARLIHLGVTTNVESNGGARLIMDIGGGSTEFIIDKNSQATKLESLYMGCVSMSRRFLAQGKITEAALQKAQLAAEQQLEHILEAYNHKHWQDAVGASGSIRSIHKVVTQSGWSEHGITIESLETLKSKILKCKNSNELKLKGLDEERKPVFVGGFIVLYATFKSLGITEMRVSDGALREGLIHDLLGRMQHTDIRYNSIIAIAERYHVDLEHAQRVKKTATTLFKQLESGWNLDEDEHLPWLQWAATIFEVGLDIAHSQYQKHSAYIIENTELSGFSKQELQLLASLAVMHRRKFSTELFKNLLNHWKKPAVKLTIILRLSIVLHRSRSSQTLPSLNISAKDKIIKLSLPTVWLDEHRLTEADLIEETILLNSAGYSLNIEKT